MTRLPLPSGTLHRHTEWVLVEQGIRHFQQLKHACYFDVDIDILNNITFSMLDLAPWRGLKFSSVSPPSRQFNALPSSLVGTQR